MFGRPREPFTLHCVYRFQGPAHVLVVKTSSGDVEFPKIADIYWSEFRAVWKRLARIRWRDAVLIGARTKENTRLAGDRLVGRNRIGLFQDDDLLSTDRILCDRAQNFEGVGFRLAADAHAEHHFVRF